MKGFKFTLLFGLLTFTFLALVVINPFKPKKYTVFGFEEKVEVVGFKIKGEFQEVVLEKKDKTWWVKKPWKDLASQKLVLNFLDFLKTQDLVKVDLKEELSQKKAFDLELFLKSGEPLFLKFFQQKTQDRRIFVKKGNEYFLGTSRWESFFQIPFWVKMSLGMPSFFPQRMVFERKGVLRPLTRPKEGWPDPLKKLLEALKSLEVKKPLQKDSLTFKNEELVLQLHYESQKEPLELKFFQKDPYFFILSNQRNSLFEIEKSAYENIFKKVP